MRRVEEQAVEITEKAKVAREQADALLARADVILAALDGNPISVQFSREDEPDDAQG